MPISNTTDKHLCAFILSPFLPSGLKSYKRKHDLEFPEPSKKVSNRLEYLKKLWRENFIKFAQICDQHGIVGSAQSMPSELLLLENRNTARQGSYSLQDSVNYQQAGRSTPTFVEKLAKAEKGKEQANSRAEGWKADCLTTDANKGDQEILGKLRLHIDIYKQRSERYKKDIEAKDKQIITLMEEKCRFENRIQELEEAQLDNHALQF